MAGLMEKIKFVAQRLQKIYFLRTGLPFILLVVGASFATTPFQEVKYEARKEKYSKELLSNAGFDLKIDMREEYEKIKAIDTSDYQNIRGPRPWEDNTEWLNNRKMQERRVQQLLESGKKADVLQEQNVGSNPL